jgi:hypothetical protein
VVDQKRGLQSSEIQAGTTRQVRIKRPPPSSLGGTLATDLALSIGSSYICEHQRIDGLYGRIRANDGADPACCE